MEYNKESSIMQEKADAIEAQQAPGDMTISRTNQVDSEISTEVTRDWAHGICGCFDNGVICIITYFFPCVTFGKVAEGIGKNCVVYSILYVIPILNCILSIYHRGQLRSIRGIPGSVIGDCCLICWCTLCALAQEGQEVEQMQREEIQRNQTQVVVVTNQAGVTYYQQNVGPNVVVPYQPYPAAGVIHVQPQQQQQHQQQQPPGYQKQPQQPGQVNPPQYHE